MKNLYLLIATFLFFQTANAQATWDTIMIGVSKISGTRYPSCYGISKTGANELFGATSTGLYKSTDNGNNWVAKSVNGSMFYSPKAVYNANSGRLLAVGGYKYAVIKSDDNGNTWDTTMAFGNSSSGEALIKTTNGNLYAAIWDNNNNSFNGVFVSTDNGNTWTMKSPFTGYNKIWTLLNVTDSIFVAGTNKGFYYSADAGSTWTPAGLNSSTNLILKIIKHPNGTLYASTAGKGIQKSTNNGQSWTASTMDSTSSATYYDIDADQAGNIYVSSFNVGVIKFDANETLVETFAGTTNGLFQSKIREFLIDESGSAPVYYIACEAAVSGADLNGYFFRRGLATGINENNLSDIISMYPNPANDMVTLNGLAAGSTITILDVTGKAVFSSIVYNDTYVLNTSEFAEGIYFVQLINNETLLSNKKLIIVK